MRVAIGGFQHETNTFAPRKADFAAFEQPDAWPGLKMGPALISTFAPPASGKVMNVPMAGFIAEAEGLNFDLVPLAWAAATPSAHVTQDAFDRIADMIVDTLERALRAGPIDAVYLDLHGAMVTEESEDGEGDLLERVRRTLQDATIPIVASLDLHANITRKMVEMADALVAYRTYPHVDMAETGARAAKLVASMPPGGVRPAKAMRKLDYLIPLTAQSTLADPAALVYADTAVIEGAEIAGAQVLSASIAMGFPPADIAECGPAVVAYAETQVAADEVANALAGTLTDFERAFQQKLWAPMEAIAYGEAADAADRTRGPLVLADTQDNPGAGGNGDTVGLLRALIEGADTALCGVLHDPDAVEAAWEAGEGSSVRLSLGAWSGGAKEAPIDAEFDVLKLHSGEIEASGPFYDGARLSLGRSVMLGIGGVRVVVASNKVQTADRAMFTAFGADPAEENIVAVKSSVHFRADFQPIARDVLTVASPGPNPADHTELAYKRLRKGVRLMPMGPAFQRSRRPLK